MISKVVPHIIHGDDIILQADGGTLTFPANPDITDPEGSKWSIQGSTKELCIEAVESCAKAFQNWSQTPLSDRQVLFRALAEIIRKNADDLRSVIQAELQCSRAWADINVHDTIALAEHIASLATSTALSGMVPEIRSPRAHGVVTLAPLGVVLGIAPWNAPAILGLRAVAAPVMAGNCAILKGSELSPRTHYFIANAFREAGFPPGVVNFAVHKPEDAPQMFETVISHPEVRKCNFTGSTAVGRQVAMRAAFHLKPVLLELGGKNFAIVLDDADLEIAATQILTGAFLNSGQICMSTDMVLASPRVKSDLSRLLREKLEDFSREHVTRLISKKSERTIESLVQDASSKGADIHTASPGAGSKVEHQTSEHEMEGRQYATVIENVTPDMMFWDQESFGPLVGITACDGLEEAIKIVNSCSYGLSAAIFSREGLKLLGRAKELNVGAVHINGATVHDEPSLPHGGCKDSGWGRFGGHWALLEFVQTQTIILN